MEVDERREVVDNRHHAHYCITLLQRNQGHLNLALEDSAFNVVLEQEYRQKTSGMFIVLQLRL